MSCPTCDHTLEGIGQNDRGDNIFHCPRCGTLLVDAFGQHGDNVYVPKLVERCRELEKLHPVKFGIAWPGNEWERLGIAEAINKPEARPR